ncbi:hypothetical protein [Kordiimonas sp.]|uniref:hypothetical protein n=1 Tax=Kordiimonas sp. TaxID=1970157 RepID=UPI003A8C8ED1
MAEILDGVTDSELVAALAGKSNTGHVHDQYQTQAETDAALAGKADADHGHTLTSLDDVEALAPSDGQSPVWNAEAGEFRFAILAAGGVVDHGALMGLTDDDHPQYHTDARADARYYLKATADSLFCLKADADTLYYRKADIDTALAAKADASALDGTVDFDGLTVGGEAVWHTGNDGTGSGLNADLVRGRALSTEATPLTVAQRDASGDLSARYMRTEYTQVNHPPETRTGDTVFFSTVDTWIRANTKAGFKASLGINNVDNTADANKPISTAMQAALDGKVSFNRVLTNDDHPAQPEQIIAANSSAGPVLITAPAAPAANTYFYVGDVGGMAATNTITIDFGAESFAGEAGEDFVIDINGFGTGFIYTGTTWRVFR